MTVTVDEDTVREMHDVHIPRVDAVDGPASGLAWLILKTSTIDPLLEVSRVLKAKYPPERHRKMLADKAAMKGADGEPTLLIGDVEDLAAVVKAATGPDADRVRRFAQHRAKALGAAHLIPTDWAADGSLITITKAADGMDDELTEVLDGGIVEAGDVVPDAAGVVAPTHEGDPDDPASPAWEAVDAARARAAVEQLVRLKALVVDMEGREDQEAATGDLGDARSAIDLDQVVSALDCALATLAKFAVDEQAEANARAQTIADQAAALGITKSIEDAVEAITKAGRVLSAQNEGRLRTAAQSLNEVLGTLPAATETKEAAPVSAAPEAVVKAADTQTPDATPEATLEVAAVEPVEKSTTPKASEPAEAAGTEPVIKAGMSPDDFRKLAAKFLQAVPDDKVGQAFQELAALATPSDAAAPAADDTTTEPATAPEPAAEAVEPPVAAPAPDPATGVLEPPAPEPDEPVQKAATGFDMAAFTAALAGVVRGEVEAAVGPITKRLEVVESTPAPGGPMLNGAGPADAAPGSGFDEIRKAIELIEDPAARRAMQGKAVHQILTGVIGGQVPTR